MAHIFVAGGSRGIGAAIVNKYAQNGHNVSYLYKNAPGPTSDNILPIKCDVCNEEEVIKACETSIKTFGTPDTLIYSSGISMSGLVTDFVTAEYHKIMDTNFGGFFLLVNRLVPNMICAKSGSIIAISSMWGQTGASCEALYSASKGAMDAYVKSLAKELGPSGIRVNAVSPGVIDTDMMKSYSEEDRQALIEETPLERIGQAKDVAEAVYYLTSDNASFITGQILGVNGGFLI